jgi:hypothetical protein
MLFELTVEMDGGETFQVVADQRDIARWEVQPFGWPFAPDAEGRMPAMSMTMFRFLGWSASTRRQLTKLTWEQFGAQCIEAMPLGDEDESALPADASDPGQTAP